MSAKEISLLPMSFKAHSSRSSRSSRKSGDKALRIESYNQGDLEPSLTSKMVSSLARDPWGASFVAKILSLVFRSWLNFISVALVYS